MNIKGLGKSFLIVGVLAIIFALVCFNAGVGRIEESVTYGGDAYTGIQNAAAETANNIVVLNKNINRIAGFFFVIVGIVLGSIGIAFCGAESSTQTETGTETENVDSVCKKKQPDTIGATYACPNCGNFISYGTKKCPSCSQNFDWGENDNEA